MTGEESEEERMARCTGMGRWFDEEMYRRWEEEDEVRRLQGLPAGSVLDESR